MKEVFFKKPLVEDLWFRTKCMQDPNTMSYNAGYDVGYKGYHYDTGCIDFGENIYQEWYDTKFRNPALYYAYIVDKQTNKYIGYVNYKLLDDKGNASMGIVIAGEYRGQGYSRPVLELLKSTAKESGVKILHDSVPKNRVSAIKTFFNCGFEKVGEFEIKKFDGKELVYRLQCRLTD